MEVKLYSKNNCSKCMFSKMFLNNQGIDFKEINIDNDEAARQELKNKGYQSLPVIDFGTDVVVGNDPTKLNQLIATV